jgi:hypothetical protein
MTGQFATALHNLRYEPFRCTRIQLEHTIAHDQRRPAIVADSEIDVHH